MLLVYHQLFHILCIMNTSVNSLSLSLFHLLSTIIISLFHATCVLNITLHKLHILLVYLFLFKHVYFTLSRRPLMLLSLSILT